MRKIAHANSAAVLGHNAIADAQAQTGSLAYRLGGVEGIKNARGLLDAGPTVGKFNKKSGFVRTGGDPYIAVSGAFQNCIDGIVYHIEKNLLQLMGIGGHN